MDWSDDLLVFLARESGRMARRPRPRPFAELTGFLTSADLIRVGVCIWFIPLRVSWWIDRRMYVDLQAFYKTLCLDDTLMGFKDQGCVGEVGSEFLFRR